MPAAPGDAGAAPPDPGYGGEGAGDGCAGTMPTPGCQGGGAGRSSGAGPCIASRPDPVAGINWDTVRAPAADAGRRQARAARHLAGIPGRRLMPAAQPAKSPGTPPGDDDLNAAAAHPGRPQTARAARRAAPSARRPGPPGTGHAARRSVSGKYCRPPGSTTGTDPGRGRTTTSPVPRTAHGKPADRAGKTGRSLAPPPAQPVSLLLPISGLDIPVLCGRRSQGAASEGN